MPCTPRFLTGRLAAIVLMAIVLAPGCQVMEKMRAPSIFARTEPAPENADTMQLPARMAVIWKETCIVTHLGQKPTRGFGARVYLYNEKNEPIRADGELIVYAFDDTGRELGDGARVPDRKYVFRQSELQQHFGETDIGPSYSFWVPWDQGGTALTTVALLPVFKPVNGPLVQAGQSIAVLPGSDTSDRTNEIEFQRSEIGARQASVSMHEGLDEQVIQAGGIEENQDTRRPTTTIHVPRSMGNRLQQLNETNPQQVPPQSRGARSGGDLDSSLPSNETGSEAAGMNLPANWTEKRTWPHVSASGSGTADSADQTASPRNELPVFGQPGRFR
jgi:hypothetical protein